MNIKEALENAQSRLIESKLTDKNEALLQVKILAREAFGLNKTVLLTCADIESEAPPEALDAFHAMMTRRLTGEPVQYILARWEFMGLDFFCRPNVLIPRQDTETLVEEAMTVTKDGDKILDLCTGSGCVLLSLMNYKNHCIGIGADVSTDALALAKANAEHLKIDGTEFIYSDLYDRVNQKFDIILSNPPYIESAQIEALQTEIKDYEPRIALDGGKDGLDFYKRIIADAPAYLHKGGYLMVEAGYGQAFAIERLMNERGFADIRFIKDLQGIDRVVRGMNV